MASSPLHVDKVTRAPLPARTTQAVELLIGSTSGEVLVKQTACHLAAHFDEILAATVSNRQHPNIFPGVMTETPGWRKIKPAIRYLKSLAPARPAQGKSTAWLDVRFVCPNNIAHAMNHLIPSALAAEALSGEKVKLLMSPLAMPRVAELLELFQVEFDTAGRQMQGRTVELYGVRGLSLFNALTYFDVSPHTLFREIAPLSSRLPVSPVRGPRRSRIYISRRGERALLNGVDIDRSLQRHGYEPVFLEDHSVEEQCRLAAQAEHVVAIHGAGMGFLALNPGLRSLIEILPPSVYHQFYPTLLADKVAHYVQILPEFDVSVPISGWDEIVRRKSQPFSLDEGLLERALLSCEAALGAHGADDGIAEAGISREDQGRRETRLNDNSSARPSPMDLTVAS